MDMKTSTKILLIFNIALLIANVFLVKYIAEAIVPTESGFILNFSPLSWVALSVLVLFFISFLVLYVKFLRNLRLSNLLFFSTLPLTLIYGTFVAYVSQIEMLGDVNSMSIKALLHINSSKNVQNLWIALATVYRVIHRLSGDGYLMKVPSGQEALFQYRNPESCSGHLHIKCSRCGCVWHIDDSISSVISREIVDACGFELLNSSMLEGICPACREGKKP